MKWTKLSFFLIQIRLKICILKHTSRTIKINLFKENFYFRSQQKTSTRQQKKWINNYILATRTRACSINYTINLCR
jgi:hypothetical protein